MVLARERIAGMCKALPFLDRKGRASSDSSLRCVLCANLHLQDFVFFVLGQIADSGDVLIGQLLYFIQAALFFIF